MSEPRTPNQPIPVRHFPPPIERKLHQFNAENLSNTPRSNGVNIESNTKRVLNFNI